MNNDSIMVYKNEEGIPVFVSTILPKHETNIIHRIRELRELEKKAEENGIMTQCLQCAKYGHGCKGANRYIYTGCAMRIEIK